MATDNVTTITGNLADDPELRFTPNGVAVCSVRVAVNRRRYDKQAGDWTDELDGFFTCNVWRDQAEHVAESLTKGARVVVVGRIRSRSYENRDGATVWVTEVEADEICPSLRWATAKVTRASRGNGASAPSSGPAAAPPPDDVPF